MQSQEVYGPQNNGYHRHNIHRSLNNHSKTFTLSLSLSLSYNLQCKFHIYSLKSKYVTHCRKWESSKQEKIHVLKLWVQNSAYVYNEIL